jgi:signal transduction histidine kinase
MGGKARMRPSRIRGCFAACHADRFAPINQLFYFIKTPVKLIPHRKKKSRMSLSQWRVAGLVFLGWMLVAGASVAATNPMAARAQILSDALGYYDSPTNGLGSWIWETTVSDNQTCQLWRSFEVPPSTGIGRARLCLTVDNEFTVFLDGRELGHGAEWRELFVFDLTTLLSPGTHVLAVSGFNSYSSAGMLLGLHIDFLDGRHIEIKSDRSWRIVPAGVKGWEKMTEPAIDWARAVIKAPFGDIPYWAKPENIDIMPTLQPIKTLFWQRGWFQITLLSVCCIVILISLRLTAQLTLHRKERRLLRRERARIAREIHDDIGARMTQIVLHGEVAQSGLPDGSEIQLQILQLCEDARGLLSTMDEILWAVNPRRDTLRDFAAFVCKYAEEFLKHAQIQCLLEVDPELSAAAFDLPLRRSLLMAIKETLNNAVKHSRATELRLQIRWQGQRLIVVVLDNGRGFDPAVIKSERNGLTNMSQRMTELGGTCVVTSQPGQGCRVEFSMPLRRSQRRVWDWLWNANPSSEQGDDAMTVPADDPPRDHDAVKC